MAFSKHAPSAATGAFIESYWIVDAKDTTVRTEKIIPDGFTEIIFHYGDPYCMCTKKDPGSLIILQGT